MQENESSNLSFPQKWKSRFSCSTRERYDAVNKRNRAIVLVSLILSLFIIQTLFSACDDANSRAKKIVSLKNERRILIDKLYAEYGGSDLSKAVNEDLKKEQAKQGADNEAMRGISDFTQSIDRGIFENNLRLVGQGERVPFITDKSREFFSRSDVVKRAQKLHEIELELQMLENTKPKER